MPDFGNLIEKSPPSFPSRECRESFGADMGTEVFIMLKGFLFRETHSCDSAKLQNDTVRSRTECATEGALMAHTGKVLIKITSHRLSGYCDKKGDPL